VKPARVITINQAKLEQKERPYFREILEDTSELDYEENGKKFVQRSLRIR
jgi:hypothetical protein